MKITTSELAERIAKLEDLVKQQDRVITNIAARTASQGQVRAAFAATNQLRREAMAAAKAEAMRTGKTVKVELA